MNWTPGRLRIRNAIVAIVPWAFHAALRARFVVRTLSDWYREGWELPLPNLLKHPILIRYARAHNLSTLVETGTYMGDTPWAFRNILGEIHTIELSPTLCEIAKERFKSWPNIRVHEGDSTQVLPQLLEKLNQPTLFWLDGHYSGGCTAHGDVSTPICDELRIIAEQCPVRFVILVDDARLFGSEHGYPSLDQFRERISTWLPGAVVSVENDIIAIVPAGK